MVLGLGLKLSPKAEASVYLGCAQESTCGWIDTDKSSIFCESSKWCMINPYVPGSFVGYGFPTSCSDSNNNRYCKQDGCYDTGAANGAVCTVVVGTGGMTGGCGSNTKISGKWDASEKQCIICSDNKEQVQFGLCGTIDAVYAFGSSCTGNGDGNLESACSGTVVTSCDDQAVGASCNSTGTCQSDGTCLTPSALTVSASPSSVIQNATNDITFTVGVTAATVSISGAGVTSDSCTTGGASGTCTIYSVKATDVGQISVSADKTGFTSGTATIAVTAGNSLIVEASPSSIPANAPRSIIFGVKNSSGAFLPNMDVELSGGYTGSCITGDGTPGGGMFGKCNVNVTAAVDITVIASDPNGVYADSAPITITVIGASPSPVPSASPSSSPLPSASPSSSPIPSASPSPAPTPVPSTTCSGPGMYPSPLMLGYCTIPELIAAAINWILGLASSIIILILIFGGITYVTSAGDEERIKTAKNTILYAIIGLALILLAYTLINEVKDILKIIP